MSTENTRQEAAQAGRQEAEEDFRRLAANRAHRTLSTRDLTRLHVTLQAAAGWLSDAGWGDWGQELAQARADLGCKRCGAMGPGQPCTTASGNERRAWHEGRTF